MPSRKPEPPAPPDPQPPPQGPGSIMMLVIQRGGLLGAVGLFLGGVGKMLAGLDLVNEGLADGILWIGGSLVAVSLWWSAKHVMHMTASAAAAGSIDRAVIINAVTPPSVNVVPQSTEPAIQNEIQKQTVVEPGGAVRDTRDIRITK